MRVLVVDESAERGELLRAALRREGYDVAAPLDSPSLLLETIEKTRPDVIVIDVDSPSRDVLEHLVMITENTPRPIVMFSADRAPDAIRSATRAGVSAYVVDGLDRTHIKAIVDAACARFEEFQALRIRLVEANMKLVERKLVERAKGLLMKARGLDEEGAYRALRRMSMEQNRRIGEVARRVIEMASLL